MTITVPKRKFLRKDNGENAPKSLALYLGSAITSATTPLPSRHCETWSESDDTKYFGWQIRPAFNVFPERASARIRNPDGLSSREQTRVIQCLASQPHHKSAAPSGFRICACLPRGGIQACPERRWRWFSYPTSISESVYVHSKKHRTCCAG